VAAEKKKAEVERKRVEEEEQKKAEEEKKRMAEEERRRKEDDTLKVVFSTRRKSIQLNNIILKKQQEEKKIEEERKAFETMVNAEVTERQSFGQSRFWFLNQALKDKTTFNMCVLVRLEGKINKKQMENAVTTVGSRHESLRTRFFATGEYMENPMQGIAPSSTIKFEHKRIKGEAAAKEEMEKMTKHTWDLERYDTMKISMLSSSDTMHWLLIACHHIIMDGFSFNVFFADLEKAYKGRRLPVLPEASQYRAFAKLQHTNWEGGLLKDDIQYYRDMIPKDLKPVPLFPFARTSTRLPLASYGANKIEVRIPAALTSKIKAASRKAKATTFHFYLATLQVLMFRLLKDCDDFFIGIADANRVDDKFTPTLGFLLNLLPMRFERNSAATFSEAVTQARNKVYGGLAHSKLPFNILLEQLDIARSSAHTPLFQIFVDYRQGVQERQKYMGVNAHGQDWHIAKSGYDMTLDILENPDGEARLELGLQKQLYTTENAKVLLDGYVTLLTAFAATPDANWTEPEVWQKEMVSKALDAGRGGKIEYEFGPTMAHRVDEMIRQHGSETALKDGSGRAMTYAEMGRRIDSIASAIISAGATNGARVAVFQQPTADWVCSLLAIFRAGAVYIPLDLRTPLTRLAAIANEAKPHAILADDHTLADANELGARDAKIINASALPAGGDATNNQAQGDGPAVILFTSGSTGTPKGIHINHTNIIKQVEGFAKQCDVKATGGCVLQQSAYSFDKSLQQIFLALANGATLYVVPAEQRGDPIAQVQIMATEGVTHTAATPSEYMMWFRYAKESLVKCNAWKFALLGGEPATEPLLEEFRNLGLPLRVINSYGPAEITMSCAKADMPYMTMQHGDPIPVGYLLPNYSAYIVDEKMQPVPIGFSGEIVLSGVGVSSGYLNNEELTQQKFTPDIFGGSGNMYRTGDKGRLGEDGMLYCEGRLDGDTQIKLRGVRMELEDIENTILQSSNGALEGAVVTLRGDQDAAFLAAHVVFSPTYTEDKDNLLTRLPTLLPLPQYMVPSVFVSLDSLPLTAHLKVDRKAIKALELPEDDNAVVEEAAELTTTESQLGAIWRDMIPRIPALQPNSNFFYIGGNSLLLVKLQAIIRKTLHANLKLIDIMNAATLSSMARLIDDNKVDHIYWESEIALPEIPASKGAAPKKGKDLTVMVTGATGVLGRRLIPQLTSDSRIAKVYCVAVRPQDGSVRSRIAEQCSKVEVKEGDLTLPRLGLSEQDAATISSSVDVIFHLGANRSFWDSYYELRPHNVQSMRELIMLSAPRKIPIHYVSSGGVTAYESTSPPSDGSDGYVASKWAAERMLANASSELGLPCVAHRPTMASGGVSDAPVEVLDELMDLAKQLQKKPLLDGLSGSLGIIPGNVIAKNVADAIFSQAATGFEIIPQYSAFNADVKSLHDRVKADTELEALEGVPALKWMGMAKKKGWSQFMVGQELTMSNAGEQVISRR
jgi:hybrid polyketide synthase/nonribosomal peptide synthetase ACE1